MLLARLALGYTPPHTPLSRLPAHPPIATAAISSGEVRNGGAVVSVRDVMKERGEQEIDEPQRASLMIIIVVPCGCIGRVK